MDRGWLGRGKMAVVSHLPVSAINMSGQKMIALRLDVPLETFSHMGILQDWRGLAELTDCSSEDIQDISNREGKTMYILKRFSTQSGSTIGRLLSCLEEMGRYDILEDKIIQDRILLDAEKFEVRENSRREELNKTAPIQAGPVDSTLQGFPVTEEIMEENNILTCHDVETGRITIYDAFVCYTNEDSSFVTEMSTMLEKGHGVKLCIPDRDLIIGTAEHSAIAKLIKHRCNKMIIILSSAYKRSAACDFMTKFGHSIAPGSMAKKLIPVMIESKCHVPDILQYITLVDYTKCDLVEWFWEKLARSMKGVDKWDMSYLEPSSGPSHVQRRLSCPPEPVQQEQTHVNNRRSSSVSSSSVTTCAAENSTLKKVKRWLPRRKRHEKGNGVSAPSVNSSSFEEAESTGRIDFLAKEQRNNILFSRSDSESSLNSKKRLKKTSSQC